MKYYKVLKENFLWEVGTILHPSINSPGYIPVDPIYYKIEDCVEYISSKIIETSPEYFQRVYKVDLVTQVIYEVRDRAISMLESKYKK